MTYKILGLDSNTMSMKTGNVDQNSINNDPLWYFLAEYSLSEFVMDVEGRDGLIAGSLFQTTRDYGIPPEWFVEVERMLERFAQEGIAHFNQGRPEFPVTIRLFCQKKMIQDVNSAKTSSCSNADLTTETLPMIHPAGSKIHGGWGYFLVERGGDSHAGSSSSSPHCVDLYLYKEGE